MNVAQGQAELLMQVFVNRTDIYAVQYAGKDQHGYRAVRSPLDLALIEEHLAGSLTLGVYALSESSTAKWMAVDLDTTDIAELQDILKRAREIMLPDPVIEFSGRRGYHVWYFFKAPVPGWQARKLGLAVAGKHEAFPKQDGASQDTSAPGSLVKAPLGIHQVSRQRSVLLNKDFEQISDPWAALESIEKVDMAKCLPLIGQGHPKEIVSSRAHKSPNRMRPCIESAMRDGAREGQRNEVGHIIACEGRRIGRPRQEVAGLLACWNLRNEPRLSQRELDLILNGAYGEKTYSYGCSSAGHLRRVLVCPGEEACLHYCGRNDGASNKQR